MCFLILQVSGIEGFYGLRQGYYCMSVSTVTMSRDQSHKKLALLHCLFRLYSLVYAHFLTHYTIGNSAF